MENSRCTYAGETGGLLRSIAASPSLLRLPPADPMQHSPYAARPGPRAQAAAYIPASTCL
jgi:hypothetical protein